jgi:alanyl-tRNA synthetase
MIGTLRIVAESSIAAGVRRIEAITAEAAENYFFAQQDIIRGLRSLVNNVPDLMQAIKKSINENADMKKQLEAYAKERIVQMKKEVLARAVERNGIKVIQYTGRGNADFMKDVAFQIRSESGERFVLIAGLTEASKCTLLVMLSDALVAEGYNAAQLVRNAARHIQGGGGGQPHFATAGGKHIDGLPTAVRAVAESLGLERP